MAHLVLHPFKNPGIVQNQKSHILPTYNEMTNLES